MAAVSRPRAAEPQPADGQFHNLEVRLVNVPGARASLAVVPYYVRPSEAAVVPVFILAIFIRTYVATQLLDGAAERPRALAVNHAHGGQAGQERVVEVLLEEVARLVGGAADLGARPQNRQSEMGLSGDGPRWRSVRAECRGSRACGRFW